MKVRLSDPSCLPELVDDLRRGGCVPSTVGEGTLEVVHPNARDAREACTEIGFFLRAWQSAHPQVEITVSSP